MKKLQRFGIVSLAALTLASLTLAQEVTVKAEENPPVEATNADNQPVADEESSIPVEEDDDNQDSEAVAEADTSAENSEASNEEVADANSDSVNQRFHLQIGSDFDLQGYRWYDSKDYYLEKGASLAISDLVGENSPWEVESVVLAKESDYEVMLTPSSVLSYEDLIEKYPYGTSLRISYKAKDFRPNSPKTSQLGKKEENAYLSVRVNHYLVTNEGLALIDNEWEGLNHEKATFSPTYKTDYINLEPLSGATLMKDYHRIEPFTVGDSIHLDDMTLKDNATVNLYYQKKGDKVSDYYNKPVLDLKQRSFQVLHVDENGQNIAEASKDYFILTNTARITKGVTVKVPSQEYRGYKARNSETFVSYDDLGDDFINSIRLVYDTVDKEAIEPIELKVKHFFKDGSYTTGFEEDTITIKPGESVTLKPKSVEGFHTLQDSVKLTYDQISKIDKYYSFYYRKNNQEWPTEEKEWSFKVVHVLDDGTDSIWKLVEKSELVENFVLKPGGDPVVPTFRAIEGWVPDLNRSFRRVRFRGGGIGVSVANYEQGVAHQYGTTEYAYVALVYKKADADTTSPDTKPEDTPSQPVDTDTKPNTGATETDTNTDGKTDVVDNGTTNPDKPSTGTTETPTTGEADKETDTKQDTGSTDTSNTSTPDTGKDADDKPAVTPETPSTGEAGKDTDAEQAVDATDKVTDSTSQEPPVLVGDKIDLGKNYVEVEEKPVKAEKMPVTPVTSVQPVAKPQVLSRVESRHLPETGDSKNSFALLALAILGLLGLYSPKRSGHKKA